MAALLLDTCAVIWLGKAEWVEPSALAQVEAALHDGVASISAITTWELGILVAKGRLALTRSTHAWFETFLAAKRFSLVDLPTQVLVAASELPGSPPNDPADRIIIATARARNLAIVTRDRRILDYGAAGHVQTVRC